MLMIYNVSSTIFHVGYVSVQNMKSDINLLVSYSLDCHIQSFVQTLTWALGQSSLHALSLLPHVALFFLQGLFKTVRITHQLPWKLESVTSKQL